MVECCAISNRYANVTQSNLDLGNHSLIDKFLHRLYNSVKLIQSVEVANLWLKNQSNITSIKALIWSLLFGQNAPAVLTVKYLIQSSKCNFS